MQTNQKGNHTKSDLIIITFYVIGSISKGRRAQDLGLKKVVVEFNGAVADEYLANQSFFEGIQLVTGKTKLQYYTAHRKKANNG